MKGKVEYLYELVKCDRVSEKEYQIVEKSKVLLWILSLI